MDFVCICTILGRCYFSSTVSFEVILYGLVQLNCNGNATNYSFTLSHRIDLKHQSSLKINIAFTTVRQYSLQGSTRVIFLVIRCYHQGVFPPLTVQLQGDK